MANLPLKSPREKFVEHHQTFTEKDLMIELLWKKHLALDKLERTRSNTSTLIWWLVVLPFIFGLIFMMLGLGSLV